MSAAFNGSWKPLHPPNLNVLDSVASTPVCFGHVRRQWEPVPFPHLRLYAETYRSRAGLAAFNVIRRPFRRRISTFKNAIGVVGRTWSRSSSIGGRYVCVTLL